MCVRSFKFYYLAHQLLPNNQSLSNFFVCFFFYNKYLVFSYFGHSPDEVITLCNTVHEELPSGLKRLASLYLPEQCSLGRLSVNFLLVFTPASPYV
ncbi:hypothetical protein FKM82_011657 [Ascaphus truei]